jgi:small GTP-binding protein
VLSNASLVKVVIAGDGNVGKTSLIRLFTTGKFEHSRVATIGVDFHTHTEQLPDGPVRLSIWDMAGQERFHFFRVDFYRGCKAAALVYDVTAPDSQYHLENWRKEILDVVPEVKMIVVGNKIDLVNIREVDGARRFADSIGSPYLETSALTGHGVSEMFHTLAIMGTSESVDETQYSSYYPF